MFSEKSFYMETPVAVSIAGSDNSSGAGIQADLKTFTHFKVYAETVVTCVVAEVPGKVLSIQPIDQTIVRDQLNLSLAHFPVLAIKTGMLYSWEIIDLVCETYRGSQPASDPTWLSIPSWLQPQVIRWCDRMRLNVISRACFRWLI